MELFLQNLYLGISTVLVGLGIAFCILVYGMIGSFIYELFISFPKEVGKGMRLFIGVWLSNAIVFILWLIGLMVSSK